MVEVDIKCSGSHEQVRLTVNGKFAADIVVGQADTVPMLMAEVAAARALRALPRIVAAMCGRLLSIRSVADEGKTPDQKAKGFLEGVEEGWRGLMIPHPYEGVPPYRPSQGTAYELGYEYGDCLRRCMNETAAICGEDPADLDKQR